MKRRLGLSVKSCRPIYFVYVLLLVLSLVVIRYVFDVITSVYPEIDMLMNSNCNNIFNMWDGRIWVGVYISVWYNTVDNFPPDHNLNMVESLEGDEHPLVPHFSQRLQNDKPVVIWGSHHKTGTYLAHKLFSKICAKMNWCCYFTRTRESVSSLDAILSNEPVDLLAHNQWIWSPITDNITNYRFIHFYRQPIKKILSGYRYHYDGMEPWVMKSLYYNETCSTEFVRDVEKNDEAGEVGNLRAKKKIRRRAKMAQAQKIIENRDNPNKKIETSISSSMVNNRPNQLEGRDLTNLEVMQYCKSIHLCETCCRKAHLTSETAHSSSNSHPVHSIDYRLRPSIEYNFMCKYLGGPLNGGSLMNGLRSLPVSEGLMAEAAVDYYESLRMAHIYADTVNDPHTLNMDLDFMIKHFDTSIGMILDHLKDVIPHSMREFLQKDLMFYDLKESPIYRWSMDNPFIGHVNSKEGPAGSNISLNELLVENQQFQQLYKPVFDLMKTANKRLNKLN